jgi:hypothetical protein
MIEKVNLFASRIAICNTIGYCLSVGIPTFLDPQIHHPLYGVRDPYPADVWIFLGAIPVLYFSYRIIIHKMDFRLKSALTGLIVLFFTWFTLPNFRPEWPHLGVLLSPISFAFLTSISVWIHFHEIDFSFVDDSSIIKEAKIEGLKLEYETWFRMFLGILAGFFLMGVSFYSGLPKYIEIFTPIKSEQFVYQGFTSVYIILVLIIFLFTICLEMVNKISEIKKRLQNIRSNKVILVNIKKYSK